MFKAARLFGTVTQLVRYCNSKKHPSCRWMWTRWSRWRRPAAFPPCPPSRCGLCFMLGFACSDFCWILFCSDFCWILLSSARDPGRWWRPASAVLCPPCRLGSACLRAGLSCCCTPLIPPAVKPALKHVSSCPSVAGVEEPAEGGRAGGCCQGPPQGAGGEAPLMEC